MIENYFRSGVRFLWNKPQDAMVPNDGAIVASAGMVTPIIYDGLDGHQAIVDPVFMNTGVNLILGLAMGVNVPYAWLDYAPGRISHVAIGGNDLLTGYMSGCLIVRGTYNGVMSAFHVGTISGNAAANSLVKNNFAQNLPANATGFNPAAAWTPAELAMILANLGGGHVAQPNVFALMTTGGVFYSILMLNVNDGGWTNVMGQRKWCVGGIKQIPAINRVRLMASLLA